MAKNITLLGASYSDVPAVNLPQTGGGTARFTDTSPTTATDSDVAQGKIYFKADGTQSTGTGSGGGGGSVNVWQDGQGYVNLDDQMQSVQVVSSLNVTENGTYTAPTGYAYNPVTVDVSGGGGWTLLYSQEQAITTSSTSQTSETNFTIPEVWTSAHMIFVRIRDKAGRRNGYYYGGDTIMMNPNPAKGSTTALTAGLIPYMGYRVDSSGNPWVYAGSMDKYGVYAVGISSNGYINIASRYNGSYSLTIDGTFLIEVYALEYPDGKSPFIP